MQFCINLSEMVESEQKIHAYFGEVLFQQLKIVICHDSLKKISFRLHISQLLLKKVTVQFFCKVEVF